MGLGLLVILEWSEYILMWQESKSLGARSQSITG